LVEHVCRDVAAPAHCHTMPSCTDFSIRSHFSVKLEITYGSAVEWYPPLFWSTLRTRPHCQRKAGGKCIQMPKELSVQEQIPFRMHPRVFAALGADLVTNDVVAVIELVKNSYDAFATRVDVAFGHSDRSGRYLDIKDNGVGMDRKTIEEAWCVVATPYRKKNPVAIKGKKTRRVAGEKGLGRLSAARLGGKLRMVTKAESEPCWLVTVDWSVLAGEESLDECFVTCRPYQKEPPFRDTGTRVRILDLNADWGSDQISDLEENLTRLISPFSKVEDFSIHLTPPDSEHEETLTTEIIAPEFLSHPPYAIRGQVTDGGEVKARYEFIPVAGGRHGRKLPIRRDWPEIRKNSEIKGKLNEDSPGCGPFSFEIRVWDIGSENTREIAEHFDIAKGNVRKAIRAHKGISVYRDNVLVLPKSEENRDWLGLDLRRISRVGTRLSTSQIVGYVSISADENEDIEDTSDREGLAGNPAVLAFQEILKAIVTEIEIQRDEDRLKPGDEVKLQALLDDVSAQELVEDMSALADEGGSAQEALLRVRNFSAKLELVRDALKKRLVYYSRLATVGTIAQMIVHEIRNRTTAIGRFLRSTRARKWNIEDNREFQDQLGLAEAAVEALEKLADTFAPLASRSFKRSKRDAILEQSIARCVSLLDDQIKKENIRIELPSSKETHVAVDPGELDTVVLNLLDNALYWVQKTDGRNKIEFQCRTTHTGERVRVTISDSGVGVASGDAEKIFLPGVTRKIGGIGMGLTVAAELVSEYGGRLGVEPTGKLGGATFTFDLPLKT
jgi:signal transduction histidine kinase